MKKTEKIILMLGILLLIGGCAKRENQQVSEILEQNQIVMDTEQFEELNNTKVERVIGEEDEGIIINADVYIYNTTIFRGKAKKTIPSYDIIEKTLCGGEQMTNVEEMYGIPQMDGKEDPRDYYALFEAEDCISAFYSYDNNQGMYEIPKYDEYMFLFSENDILPAGSTSVETETKEIMESLGMNVIQSRIFLGQERNSDISKIQYYNVIDGIPVINTSLGMDYTSVKIVDSEIAQICFAPNYEFLESTEQVDTIITIESLMNLLQQKYNNGEMTIIPETIIDKISLVYMEKGNEEVIPIWLFSTKYAGEDNIIYIFDAIDGQEIYNIKNGMIKE